MQLKLEIIRATEFVRVGAEGHIDLAGSKAALASVALACRKRGTEHAILDLRALRPKPKPIFSPADLVELVNTFPEVGFTRRLRLAILYSADPHRRARLFAFLSNVRGWNVRAFGGFEEGLLWLSREEPSAETHRRASGEKAIPIQFGKRRSDAHVSPKAVPRAETNAANRVARTHHARAPSRP